MFFLIYIINVVSPIVKNTLLYFVSDDAGKNIDFIAQLYDLSPIIGLLLLCIGYLIYSIKIKNEIIDKKDVEIKELNEYIRDNEADNGVMLEKLANSLDKVIASHQHDSVSIINQIERTKEILTLKIDNLK